MLHARKLERTTSNRMVASARNAIDAVEDRKDVFWIRRSAFWRWCREVTGDVVCLRWDRTLERRSSCMRKKVVSKKVKTN
jgi:hypothetical protein